MPDQTDATQNDDGDAQVPPPVRADDGQPGLPIPGYPGLRAGAFDHGNGVLGIYRVGNDPSGGSAGSAAGNAQSPSGLIPTAYFGKRPEVLPDYQTKSWR